VVRPAAHPVVAEGASELRPAEVPVADRLGPRPAG
jgi:hypothetical protein